MRTSWSIRVVIPVTLAVTALACNRPPATPAAPALLGDMKAVVSVKELMQNMIDPIADNIFDAVGSDISEKGVVDTAPKTDEDWAHLGRLLQRIDPYGHLRSIHNGKRHYNQSEDWITHVSLQHGMAATDVNARWQAEMASFFESLDGRRPDEAFLTLPEVFHLD